MTQVQQFGFNLQAAASFICTCVCVCVDFLSANLRGTGVHIEKRHTGELHASDQKNKRRREKNGIPLQSREPRHEGPKLPRSLKPKKNPSDQTCLKSWKHPVWLVHVSHGITDFWCHPVGHFEGIFFPLPSQNNLNKFSAAYFNFQSIFDVLFVWLCLPECKKKRKKISMCTDRQPLVAHLPCARLGLILIYFFFGGDQSELPSCFAPSKHQMHETRKLVEGRPVGSGRLVMSISTVNDSIFFFHKRGVGGHLNLSN